MSNRCLRAMGDDSTGNGSPRLKVLFYQFFPGGGIGRYTHELASAMQSNGEAKVEVACSEDFEFQGHDQYRLWTGLRSIQHPTPWRRKLRFLGAQWWNPNRCLLHAKAVQADVIHFSNINHLSYPFWRSRLLHSPHTFVATAHDVRRGAKIINRSWENRALQQFYRDAGALFVHSEQQVEDLCDFAQVDPEKVYLVPHGIYAFPAPRRSRETLKAELGIPSGRRVALFFGMVRQDKNLEGLLEGLARIKQERPFLVVAGRMPEHGNQSEAHFQRRIGELGLEADVCLVNRFVATEEVGNFYQLADFSCLTYLDSFTSQSGVLNVAMHFACPIVVTPAPTLAETAKRFDIGIHCVDHGPAAIARGIEAMSRRLDEGIEFDFGSYRKAHSWEENARRTVAVYREICRET